MGERMTNAPSTILLVSNDRLFCADAHRELQALLYAQIHCVTTVSAAREFVQRSSPAVILLEAKSLVEVAQLPSEKKPRLDSVVACLAGYAPVVVIAEARFKEVLTSLAAAGAADFIEQNSACLKAAIAQVQRRLRNTCGQPITSLQTPDTANSEATIEQQHVGQLLRHELNNPLTGILGNAELLLAEVRRKNDGRLPCNTQHRLETIAALAVRMRETVRRLSHQLESR
jgi:signal transduction histidine kinase